MTACRGIWDPVQRLDEAAATVAGFRETADTAGLRESCDEIEAIIRCVRRKVDEQEIGLSPFLQAFGDGPDELAVGNGGAETSYRNSRNRCPRRTTTNSSRGELPVRS